MSNIYFAYYLGLVFGVILTLIFSRIFRKFVLWKQKQKRFGEI